MVAAPVMWTCKGCNVHNNNNNNNNNNSSSNNNNSRRHYQTHISTSASTQ